MASARVKAQRIADYLAIGGNSMATDQAAAALGVSARVIRRYRTELIAAGTVSRRPVGPAPSQPCGTHAAYRRHHRRGEPADAECQAAEARRNAARAAQILSPDYREKRNNMPDVPRYAWRARKYPWALRAIAQAEAVHGAPQPTCECGQPIPDWRSWAGARCETCAPAQAPRMADA